MSLKIDKKELNVKNKIVDDAIAQLKKEFIGIDEQIDTIMSNVRVWFLYPQLQSSPCVVNVFGMTGCGKSSLVKRIAELLDVEKNYVYFNFCSINEQSSWEIEQDIEEQLDNECSNRIFVFDEFQYAASIRSNGEENENKNGLKPFWELLDTGVIHKRNSYWEVKEIAKVLMAMSKINVAHPMVIKNGVWINASECLADFTPYDMKLFDSVFNYTRDDNDRKSTKPNVKQTDKSGGMDVDEECSPIPSMALFRDVYDSFFIREGILSRITSLYSKAYNVVCEVSDVYQKLLNMDVYGIMDWLHDVYTKAQKGYDLKFDNSIIFVIANLDEAYNVAFDVNPDMSPDQFNKITKKISVVDIKKALQKRFRNEQIARLGNIHVIYPSFTSDSFKKIITLNLEAYGKKAKELCGVDIEFDESVKNMIFKESVYPTHGTRPIFSSIHEIIKTKLPYIIRNVCENNKDKSLALIRYGYKGKKMVITVFDKNGKEIDTYKFSEKLRLEEMRSSTTDEKQADTAVHESGHFVVYSYLNGKVPEKVVSRSVDRETEGFMMEDVDDDNTNVGSRIDILNEIKVCLGGYVAEGIIFGESRRSGGASSDLNRATKLASKMVRKLGLGGVVYVTTYSNNQGDLLINENNQDDINECIKNIMNTCLEETKEIINKPHIMKMLKSSSKYLLTHSQIPKTVMKKLLEEAKAEGYICEDTSSYYRDIVSKF